MLSQMCRHLRNIARLHFQRKYRNLPVRVFDNGIYFAGKPINSFSKFIENITFSGSSARNSPTEKTFRAVHENCNQQLKQITFQSMTLNAKCFEFIKPLVEEVEKVILDHIGFHTKLHSKVFFGRFLNLKHLTVLNLGGENMDWLSGEYPELDYFVNESDEKLTDLNKLRTFFNMNPNIKTVVTIATTFRENRQAFGESNLKLDDFNLCSDPKEDNIGGFEEPLSSLHSKGFYKQLHLKNFRGSLSSLPALTVIALSFNDQLN